MSHATHDATAGAKTLTIPPGHSWNRLPVVAGGLGILGLALTFFYGSKNLEQLYFSWLVSFLFYLSLALGGLFFVLTHYVTKASWSVVVRRIAEVVMSTMPLFILLFIPIVFGMHDLFHWTHTEAVAEDPLLQGKQSFLNVNFFLIRAGIYFLCWTAMSWWFFSRSKKQDQTGDPGLTLRMIQVSAPALFVYAITVTLAAVDWIMSLDPHWYSTMFGVYYFAGCLVGIFALMSILTVRMDRAGLFGGAVTVEHVHDLGKLLFAFTVFWAYIAFSQYFLIWYGNIPEETLFYKHRAEGSWKIVSMLLGWGHFGVPFLFLMSRNVKRRYGLLVLGSLWMLLMHLVDLHWLIMPTLHHHGVHVSPLDLTTLVGMGGLFMALIGWRLRRQALIPARDPRLAESLSFENV